MIRFPKSETTLTISMWDYSWLKCGHPGGAFHDLPRRVAEAAERGYNTLRIDAFPHFYVEPRHHFDSQGMSRRFRTWGDVLLPQGYGVDVRRQVVALADLCRKHQIRLALDTWMSFDILGPQYTQNGGMIEPSQEEAVCRAWSQAWVKALKLMRDDGVLERAAWIAPLNEVPLFLGSMMRSVKVSDPEVRHEGQTGFRADLPELDALFQRVNTWLGDAIADEVARDGIPLAYSSLGAENYHARVTDLYDVIDVHFMPDVFLGETDKIALEKAGAGASRFSLHDAIDAYDLALYSAAWDRALERNYPTMLRLAHDYADNVMTRCTLASGKRLAAVVTEPYGPCNFPDHPEVSWEGYKRWNADAARIFASRDFAGLSLSNHAEPLFSLWDDAPWHRRGNDYVHSCCLETSS
jgi:hypothetical protein